MTTAFIGVDGANLRDSLCHFLCGVHQESSAPVIDDLAQRASTKRDHGSAACHRFHGDQRAGFSNQAWDEDACGIGEELLFPGASDRAEEAARTIEAGVNLAREIVQMLWIFIQRTCQ